MLGQIPEGMIRFLKKQQPSRFFFAGAPASLLRSICASLSQLNLSGAPLSAVTLWHLAYHMPQLPCITNLTLQLGPSTLQPLLSKPLAAFLAAFPRLQHLLIQDSGMGLLNDANMQALFEVFQHLPSGVQTVTLHKCGLIDSARAENAEGSWERGVQLAKMCPAQLKLSHPKPTHGQPGQGFGQIVAPRRKPQTGNLEWVEEAVQCYSVDVPTGTNPRYLA